MGSVLGFVHIIVATGSWEINCRTLNLYLETTMAKYSSKSHVIMMDAHTLLSDGHCRLSPPEIPSENRNSHQQLALWSSVHFPLRLIVMCLSLSSWPGGALKSITSISICAKKKSTMPCI